ncbi:MAG TPA: polymer-forming cytoskeletal protein [Amoebophilaceae bacterium]|jgi:cytoskeletal protein CcmA (bactofilin family)|nr:polymer-forming cytoskeletal protein [Amoebophilaceae bacterium]
MFQNKPNKDTSAPVTIGNIIGQGTHLEGTIVTTGNLRIEGNVTGGIQTKAKVVLSNTAHVRGNIVAQNAEIGGTVHGTIETAELLVFKSTAVVEGDIIATKLVFEEGAYFDGKCKMGGTREEQKADKLHAAPSDLKEAKNPLTINTKQIFQEPYKGQKHSMHTGPSIHKEKK